MPWLIVREHGQHCVYKQLGPGKGKTGDSLGCHDTRDEAIQQLRALYASERDRTAAAAAQTTQPQPAPPADPAGAGVSLQPVAAGVALCAADTGRTLFIQRALVDGEPNGGLWEIPGGTIDGGETPWEAAQREFGEEVGHPLPDGELMGTWLSPNGVYQGFCYCVAEEASLPLDQTDPANRAVDNPDNPQGSNYTEAAAWMDPAHLDRGPRLLRPEMRTGTPWSMLKNAGSGMGGMKSMAAAGEVEVKVNVGLELDEEAEGILIASTIDQLESPLARSLLAAAPQLNAENRRKWAKSGVALPDGSFPIPDCSFVTKAVHRMGSSNHPASQVKAHIIKRARALGCELPKEWKSMTASAVEEFEALVASLAQPASALLPEDPLPGPTPYSVRDDGTADGHLALWASCHVGYPGCVTPPREDSFDFYNLGDTVTADGRHVPIGKVTVGCGHAGPDLSWRTAAAHYDESGTAVAVSHAIADKWGIRLPSVLVADASGAQIDELRRSPLSGDWRRINGRLRLVAALGVNVPGYPVPRPMALVAAGEVQSMFVGFDPEDAARVVAEADSLAASIGLDAASRAVALRAGLGLPT